MSSLLFAQLKKLSVQWDRERLELVQFPVATHPALVELYRSGMLEAITTACIMNGLLAEAKTQFLLSQNLLKRYLTKDPNVDQTMVSKLSYKALNRLMVRLKDPTLGLMVCIRPSSSGGPISARAGLYEIRHPTFFEIRDGLQ